MDSSLYAGLSRQVVLRRSLDMVENIIANVSTPGYRQQNPMFEEYLSKPRGASESLSLVYDRGQYTTTTAGPASYTGDTYDVALNGPGFIAVRTVTGQTQYTRAGNFTIDNTGTIVTASGFQVGVTPIVIPDTAKEVKITDDGTVYADDNVVGQISVVEFANLQDMKPEGNGLYSATNAGTPAVSTTMKQGMLEGSNVNAVGEMTKMIEISRNYESMMSMMNKEAERELGAIQRLAKVTGQ